MASSVGFTGGQVEAAPWPEEVSRYFQTPIAPAGTRLWTPIPEGFDWEQAIREHSRRLHDGQLVYPRSWEEKRAWKRAVYEGQGFGRRVGSLSSPAALEAERLGFTPLQGGPLQPGDLMIAHDFFFVGVAVLTQVTVIGEPIEVLVPQGLSLYLTAPENVGSHRSFYRYHSDTKPESLRINPSLWDREEARSPARLAELRAVAAAIEVTAAPYRILHRSEGSSGLSDPEWLVDFDLANGDWAILHLQATGQGSRNKLVVIIDYSQQVASDPPDFISVLEAALQAAARAQGFCRLAIYYKLIYPLSDPKFAPALAQQGYTQRISPGWGRLRGKQLRIG